MNLRNVVAQQINGLSEVNVFVGDNGAGKTSILEAIHTLGYGRSFRKQGGQKDALVRYGCDRLVIFGERQSSRGLDSTSMGTQVSVDRLGLSRAVTGEIQIKINGDKLHRLSDMALRLPAIALNSDTFELLTGAASERRRYIDWAVFHVEHGFRETSKRYINALQQRNSILKRISARQDGRKDAALSILDQDNAELNVWTSAVAQLGTEVAEFRDRQVVTLKRFFNEILDELNAGDLGVALGYRRGWGQGVTLQESLEQGLNSDISRGFTQYGPHRADLQVLVGKDIAGQARLARDVLSRGQLKVVVLAMKLAQARFFEQARFDTHEAVVHIKEESDYALSPEFAGSVETLSILLDDVAAEFDPARLRAFGRVMASMLQTGGIQIFATSTTQSLLHPLLEALPERSYKVFHVEHGEVSAAE